MRMLRRSWLGAGALILSASAMLFAQPSGRVWRVGVLLDTIPFERLRTAIREVGLEEGKNLQFEVRSAQGQPERLDALAAELELVVNLKTAAELGIKVPEAMLLRANQVIR
jgi:hypothetical protein